MPNKKTQSEKPAKTETEKRVESLMGPTVEDADLEGAPKLTPGEVVDPTPDLSSKSNEPTATDEDSEEIPDDAVAEKAVDDIAAKESDEVLEAEDAELQKAFQKPQPKGFKTKVKDLVSRWWNNPIARWTTIVGAGLLLIGLALIPTSRYFFLNSVGVRAKASVVVVDEGTQLPLKNVQVTLGNQSGVTDKEGKVQLQKVKLGRTHLIAQKRAFAQIDKPVTIGWGSNPLGNFPLKAVGAQYVFYAKDFLSDKAIEGAEATSGEASALADKNGKIVLTVEASDKADMPVTIKADSYRDEQFTFNLANKTEQQVKMVPARKHPFISKRSGKYDVYKIDADGKNEELVLAGTGKERDDIDIFPSPNSDWVALVSTRNGTRNKDGFLLSSLLLINLSNNDVINLVQSERIQIVGWSGDRITYVQIAAGASASNPKRQRLMTYDYKTKSEAKELAASNSFNDVMQIGDDIYYAPSATYQGGQAAGLYKVSPDGSKKQTLIDRETWNLFRSDYDKFLISVQQDWYELKFGDSKPSQLSHAPVEAKNRVYVDSPDKKHSLWIDQRDGKGAAILLDVSSKSEKVLRSQSGLAMPTRWLNNTVFVYRVHTDQETADYVISVDGGEPRKIRDVTNTNSSERWYYY